MKLEDYLNSEFPQDLKNNMEVEVTVNVPELVHQNALLLASYAELQSKHIKLLEQYKELDNQYTEAVMTLTKISRQYHEMCGQNAVKETGKKIISKHANKAASSSKEQKVKM